MEGTVFPLCRCNESALHRRTLSHHASIVAFDKTS
ncbi:hypothetical protein D031_0693A, partial [Vibrio parahaemolyticus VP-48]